MFLDDFGIIEAFIKYIYENKLFNLINLRLVSKKFRDNFKDLELIRNYNLLKSFDVSGNYRYLSSKLCQINDILYLKGDIEKYNFPENIISVYPISNMFFIIADLNVYLVTSRISRINPLVNNKTRSIIYDKNYKFIGSKTIELSFCKIIHNLTYIGSKK